MKSPIKYDQPAFDAELKRILERGLDDTTRVEPVVREILNAVRKRGDRALLEYTERFDRMTLFAAELHIGGEELERHYNAIAAEDREALELCARRIRAFHQRQLPVSWLIEGEGDEEGESLGQRITALDAVGLYVPGGKASYPSSVLMNAIPAKVAGVKRTAMVCPTPGGEVSSHVLAAAHIVGVDEVYCVGGAQAVAALAYGTETIPKVDKIVGPGNIYVATAKRLVYGTVDIDMVAGPSEILIVNDGTGDPAHLAADLLSQAEHDEMATTVMVTTDNAFGEAVCAEVERQLGELSRSKTARVSWEERGAVFVVETLEEACDISNRFAPEHLELAVAAPFDTLEMIRHAGAIFLGHNTPEALGDYAAGPNHVLPTAGTARFYSPLGVEDFIKRSSLLSFSAQALKRLADPVIRVARLEGLDAHARAVELRVATLEGQKSRKD
jgi:histidinol dehydrogenase